MTSSSYCSGVKPADEVRDVFAQHREAEVPAQYSHAAKASSFGLARVGLGLRASSQFKNRRSRAAGRRCPQPVDPG